MLISASDKRISPFLAGQLPAVVAYLAQHKQLNKQVHRTTLAHSHTHGHKLQLQQQGLATHRCTLQKSNRMGLKLI